MIYAMVSWVIYGVMFYLYAPEYGRALGALATIPVIITGWCCGLWAGLLAGCATIPLHFMILTLGEGVDLAAVRMFSVSYVASHLVFVVIGGVTGRLCDLQVQIRHQMAEHETLVEQLQQSQKMEAIGQLAGGIAHDFNNILMIMNGHASVLLNGLSPEDRSYRSLDEIRLAGEQASWLTQQLLAFSRRQTLNPQILDLNHLLAETQRLLQRLIKKNITMVTTLTSSLGNIRVDPGQMQQVIMNLVVNAGDAMPDGGKLSVETTVVDVAASEVERNGVSRAGRYVLLTVSDTGCGMDEETLARVFEPFYTTKEHGKGTGLGLSTVYGIVKQSEGAIRCDSALEQGTTFYIYLPCVEGVLTEKSNDLVSTDDVTGQETILLVEDDARMRLLTKGMLEQRGYTILDAAEGAQALEQIDTNRDAVSLVVTDMMMPRMNGKELADRLHAQNPGLKILYISGYRDNPIVDDAIEQSQGAFLAKPFTALELGQKVREVLEA